MEWYGILFLIIGIFLLLIAGWIAMLVYFGVRRACFFKRVSREKCIRYDMERGFYSPEEYEEFNHTGEHFQITSPLGYSLNAMRILCGSAPSDKVVILVHGYRCHMYTSVKYVKLFKELGFDCIIYDNRYHGDSGGNFCTLSGLETEDLLAVAETVGKMYPIGTKIGLHGESMGAATVMNALDSNFKFAFCIEDCGFASAAEQLQYLTKRYTFFLRKPVYHLMLKVIYRKTGVDFEKVSPLNAVSSERAAATPMLFIHGEADRFVPFDNVKWLYDAKKGVKAIYTVPGVRHAEAVSADRDRYWEKVRVFVGGGFVE